MKTRLIIALAICLLGSQTLMNAQDKGQAKEKPTFEQIAQMKAERMAEALTLDDKTAEKFIQVYKEYLAEKKDLRKNNRPQKPQAVPGGKKVYRTDAEVEKMLLDRFDQRQKQLDLDRKYYEKFRKILGPKQIQKVYALEKAQMNRLQGGAKGCTMGSGHNGCSMKADHKGCPQGAGKQVGRPAQPHKGQPTAHRPAQPKQ